jgi:hypothetical protein
MDNLTNAIDAVMNKEALGFKEAITTELARRLHTALDEARSSVANAAINSVVEETETTEEEDIQEKVEIDGRTSAYRATVTRIEQARKMREQRAKSKEMAEADEKFNGLYDDGSGRGARIPKPLDINPNRFTHLTKESVEIEEDEYAGAVAMQNGKFTMKEEELSPKQKAYRAFFEKALKKFGADSPAEMDTAKKKEFFNYIQKNWKG